MNKFNKKLLALFLVICLGLGSFAACGDSDKENDAGGQTSERSQQAEEKEQTKEEKEQKSEEEKEKSGSTEKASENTKNQAAEDSTKNTSQNASSEKNNNKNAGSEKGAKEDDSKYCYITITRHTLADKKDQLSDSLKKMVPDSGVILAKTKVKIQSGDSALDITKRATKNAGIHLSYQGSSRYNTAYVEGINNIYEKDFNSRSGWIYKINGKGLSKGCSAYKMKSGDVIRWEYTCNLGKDL